MHHLQREKVIPFDRNIKVEENRKKEKRVIKRQAEQGKSISSVPDSKGHHQAENIWGESLLSLEDVSEHKEILQELQRSIRVLLEKGRER